MAKITNLKDQQNIVLAEMNELLTQFSEVLGLNCKVDFFNYRHDGNASMSILLEIPVTNSYELNWEKKCFKFGLSQDCLHKVYNIKIRNRVMNVEVLGIWSMRKQRYPVVVKNVRTGKLWKIPVYDIKEENRISE